MKRMDNGKVTLVEFISSIKFPQQPQMQAEVPAEGDRFAAFEQQARPGFQPNTEEHSLVRSGN